MRRQIISLGTLTIALGATESNEISLNDGVQSKIALGTLVDLVVFAPSTLPETVTVQLSWLDRPATTDWRVAYVAGADVTVPAGKAVSVPMAAMKALRLQAGGAVAAARVFHVLGQADI